MKIKHLLIVSLFSLAIASCTTEVSNKQPNKTPAPVSTSVTASSTQTKPLGQSAESQNSAVIKSGTFVSGEHTTQGTVRITNKDGKSSLELDQSFTTSEMGPDLVVILHRSDNVINSTKPPSYPLKKGDYIVIAPLQKYSGAQAYSIPQNINLADYKSVAIWCRKFNATFGTANLSS
ncbi:MULTISPECIES: DM13 domain-containing protein [Nostoc]|uniref:DM13 domain-containing protein n=1 Tax=Nostoc paludosum FACHB-159 TaxID=2692908 RepID=A0ABR8KE55_9NOSO|nr:MULTISPECIES: DM13 domain-containing protein [Nostoc]MBD2681656.1 DM13 domain-containing protein [Nostoc sp. FACHB-857]MBD2737840.1 DM13 domain-containing protein [Nostoc paludosum FACHB-159]